MYFYIAIGTVLYTIYFFLIKPKKNDFANKNVILTGGSTGIGKELAILLVKEKANVTILARNQSKLDEAEAELRKYCLSSQRIASISCDVTDKASVASAIEKSVKQIGTPDVLVTCAGLATPGYFIDQDLDVFDETMQVDYFGTLYAVKSVVPHFVKKNRGSIVMVTSTIAVAGFVGYSSYAPAKYAVRGLAEVLRSELKPYNIDISLVYPPDTKTPGFDRENLTKPPETLEISASGVLATAETVARHILNGMKRGDYHINADFITKLFIMGSNGLTPRQFGLFEIILAPISTIFEMIITAYFDYVVVKHSSARKKNGSKKSD